ncbi:MAG: biosynthetic-type acetolactate synthase large subunit [Candidatus Moranbacteria bacterium]|nr:biosynthetic-type acetolactate synthase large subunit [Candidatus Moranbacteria bacterium]
MTGADILLKSLIKEKVEIIFGYPGGVTIPLHDKLKDYPQIKHILPRHEQGGAMMADGYFRRSGKVGVCLSTSGPGATNLITGVANAYMDSVGMVVITCQVATNMVGTDAFQEVDITGITQHITKHNYFVEKVEHLPRIIKEAFYLASTGRPRPVHIDIPVDVLKAEAERFDYPKKVNIPGYCLPEKTDPKKIEQAVELIKKSARPVALVGHGVAISKAEKQLMKFVESCDIPVITTLLGIGSIQEDHRLSFGMLGMHGMAWANYAVSNADLLIGVGLRFDDRITGRIEEFAQDANVIHIDIDKAEIGKNKVVDIGLLGDCKTILTKINQKNPQKSHKEWINQIRKWEKETQLGKIKKQVRLKKSDHLMAQDIIAQIDKQTRGMAVITSDVGQNQMWSAQYYKYKKPNQLLSSGGLGAMGFGLPASIGAKFATPKSDVWAIIGDGGFQMNIQELGTIMEYKLPVKIVILNNGYLGMVRQWQELFYKKNYCSTRLINPNFVQIAKAYDIEAYRIKDMKNAEKYIKKAAAYKKPILLEFVIGQEDCVFPMVPPGNTLKETIIKRK